MDSLNKGLILFWCILDFGKGSKIFKLYKDIGGVGGTIFLGRGTIKNEILNMLGILDSRKEIFFAVIDEDIEDDFYDGMMEKFALDKPNHGVAFSMPLKYSSRINDSRKMSDPQKKGVENLDYEAIFIVVDKGSMDEVLEAAESAGSTGGTIIHGRGSGTEEKETLFNIQIEPEKEIILILSREDRTEPIVKAVKERLNLEDPGTGIVFVMDISRTEGLYQEQ